MQRGVTGASAAVAPPCARASCALPRGRARSPCTAPCGRLSAAQDHAHARNCTYAHARTRTHCDCIGGLCIPRKREDTVRTKHGTPHDMARAIDMATSDGARSQAQCQSRCRCGGEPSPGADVAGAKSTSGSSPGVDGSAHVMSQMLHTSTRPKPTHPTNRASSAGACLTAERHPAARCACVRAACVRGCVRVQPRSACAAL